MSQDGPQNAQQGSDTRHSAPAMPRVPRSEVYRGSPRLLLDSSVGYNVGWQEDRKAGPSFVVVHSRGYMTSKVTERFPMTEQGWSLAWDALVGHDPASAERILAILENREARQRVRDAHTALDDETLCLMRSVTFNGGTGMAPLAKGQTCDLRFMSDKVMVCAHRSADAIIEMPYRDVGSVDVTSSNTTRPGGPNCRRDTDFGSAGGGAGNPHQGCEGSGHRRPDSRLGRLPHRIGLEPGRKQRPAPGARRRVLLLG